MDQEISIKIKFNIFKRIEKPLNLMLACKEWRSVANNSETKAELIINTYGIVHALFHAVRLGPSFIDLPTAQAMIAKRAILSRYFIQMLLLHYGNYDPNLIGQKISHNVRQTDADRVKSLQERLHAPWASYLELSVCSYFLTVTQSQFEDNNLCMKGNDMELFHFLSAEPYMIKDAPGILQKNMNVIEDLILNKKFIPFPPRPPRKFTEHCTQHMPKEYPSKDGYENNRLLNIIARSILICKDLVLLWKEIGYYEICSDVNDLVIQGSLLILFPPNPPIEWVRPDVKTITVRLMELIELSFQLSYNVIGNILYLFEVRLEDIGESLIESFIYIKQDFRDNLLNHYLTETSGSKHSSNKPVHQIFAVQRQNNNHQPQRLQNASSLQRLQNTSSFQRTLNTGRQAAGPQNTLNLFIDTYTLVQQYNDLVGGTNSFFRTQDVEISPQSTHFSIHLFLGFSFT